jgi:predicted TIM-barrel fold metal-dependent hydrolase
VFAKVAHVFGRLRRRRIGALSDDRIGDEKYEKLPQQTPLLSKEPSYYVKNHPIYFSCELEEKILPYVLGLGLEKKIMYPSDYPHERPTLEEFLADIPRFRARKDLSDEIKKLILRDNCIDCYSLKLSK